MSSDHGFMQHPDGQRKTRGERNNELIAAGVHPATRKRLVDDGRRCEDCPHLRRMHRGVRVRIKCINHQLGTSRSEASDVRVSWPACELIDIGVAS